MSARALPIMVVGHLVVLLLAAGCATQPAAQVSPSAPTASVPVTPSAGQPTARDVTKGTKGAPTTIGSWTVTVRQSEFGSGNKDVNVEAGKTRLTVEVNLSNGSASSLSVGPNDWSAVDAAGVTYAVLPSSRADKQGERTVPAGKTEDVSVNFAVPSSGGVYTLRFAPANGGPGTLEVPLQ